MQSIARRAPKIPKRLGRIQKPQLPARDTFDAGGKSLRGATVEDSFRHPVLEADDHRPIPEPA